MTRPEYLIHRDHLLDWVDYILSLTRDRIRDDMEFYNIVQVMDHLVEAELAFYGDNDEEHHG